MHPSIWLPHPLHLPGGFQTVVQSFLHSGMQPFLKQVVFSSPAFMSSRTGPRAAVVATAATILAIVFIYPRHHMRVSLIKILCQSTRNGLIILLWAWEATELGGHIFFQGHVKLSCVLQDEYMFSLLVYILPCLGERKDCDNLWSESHVYKLIKYLHIIQHFPENGNVRSKKSPCSYKAEHRCRHRAPWVSVLYVESTCLQACVQTTAYHKACKTHL